MFSRAGGGGACAILLVEKNAKKLDFLKSFSYKLFFLKEFCLALVQEIATIEARKASLASRAQGAWI